MIDKNFTEEFARHLQKDYSDSTVATILSQTSLFLKLLQQRGISIAVADNAVLIELLTKDVTSRSTLNVKIFSMTALLNYLLVRGIIENNPLQDDDLSELRNTFEVAEFPAVFKDDDAVTLSEFAKSQFMSFRFADYILISVLISGLRLSEIVRIEWNDFDVEGMKLSVRGSDGNVSRVIPISGYIEREYLQRSLLLVDESVELVLPRYPALISSRLIRLLNGAGIAVKPKHIRSWYIRSLIKSGFSDEEISCISGASVAYLQRYM